MARRFPPPWTIEPEATDCDAGHIPNGDQKIKVKG